MVIVARDVNGNAVRWRLESFRRRSSRAWRLAEALAHDFNNLLTLDFLANTSLAAQAWQTVPADTARRGKPPRVVPLN